MYTRTPAKTRAERNGTGKIYRLLEIRNSPDLIREILEWGNGFFRPYKNAPSTKICGGVICENGDFVLFCGNRNIRTSTGFVEINE